jgi:hypothetical protein
MAYSSLHLKQSSNAIKSASDRPAATRELSNRDVL